MGKEMQDVKVASDMQLNRPKDVFLLYEGCCMYEIVILNYFMKFTNAEVFLVSKNGAPVKTIEGYQVSVDGAIDDVEENNIRSFIVTGGDISEVRTDKVKKLIASISDKNVVIGAICAGVDLLDESGILDRVKSTHSHDVDVANDKRIITARANAYVDFAIEVGKELKMFKDEEDLQETIDFWKHHQRMKDKDLEKNDAVSLYSHVKELGERKYESELRREDSLILQSSQMQTAFAFMTVALFMPLPIIIEYRGVLSLGFIVGAVSSIVLALLLSLVFASLAQRRIKKHELDDIENTEKAVYDNWELCVGKEQQLKQWVRVMKKVQASLTESNERRVTWIQWSMLSFWLSIGLIIFWCFVGTMIYMY